MNNIHDQQIRYRPETGKAHWTETSNGFEIADMQPELVVMESVSEILQKGIFKTVDSTIVEQADMEAIDMLEAILKKQAPKQKELRQKNRDKAKRGEGDKKKEFNLVLVS